MLQNQKLIVFSGLPGVGKTTLSQRLAKDINAVYLRIDTIEQTLKNSELSSDYAEDVGYQVAFSLAEENLLAENSVIADSVNPLNIIREKWAEIAKEAEAELINIEIICSDKHKHQRRIEERVADIKGHQLPSWKEVDEHEYETWNTSRITIETANLDIDAAYETVLERLN